MTTHAVRVAYGLDSGVLEHDAFVRRLVTYTVTTILPPVLRAAGFQELAAAAAAATPGTMKEVALAAARTTHKAVPKKVRQLRVPAASRQAIAQAEARRAARQKAKEVAEYACYAVCGLDCMQQYPEWMDRSLANAAEAANFAGVLHEFVEQAKRLAGG